MEATQQHKPHTPPGESDYLAGQAADARDAINRVTADLKRQAEELKRKLAGGADPSRLTRQHPLPMLGAAVAAGFAAAAALVPSKESQALRRLAEFERLASGGRSAASSGDGEKHADGEKSGAGGKGQSIWVALLHEVMSVAKPAISSAIAAGISAKTATDSNEKKEGFDPDAPASATGGGAF